MKIVVADPIFLTEEYIKRLEALGELEIYDSVPASLEEFIDRIKDAEIVIVGRHGVNAEALRSAPKLKMISLWQTGFDNVDLEAATERGVIISNVPNYALTRWQSLSLLYPLIYLEKSIWQTRTCERGYSIGSIMWATSS